MIVLAVLVAVEVAGLVFALALCRAAARRPVYGPPLRDTEQHHGR